MVRMRWLFSGSKFLAVFVILSVVSVSYSDSEKTKKKSIPLPFSIYYADHISAKLRIASMSFTRDGVTMKTIGREMVRIGEILQAPLETLRTTVGPEEVVEMQFGVTRAAPPDSGRAQYGQVGFGEDPRKSRIFDKKFSDFEKTVDAATLEVIRSENQYFTPRRSEYGGSFNPDWWESQIRQGKSRKPPYFLGFISKLRVSREKSLIEVQIALGLRPAQMDLYELSDPLEIHEMQVPYPASIEGIDYAPIALIHITGDSEILESKDPRISMKITFGSFGEFRRGDFSMREDPLWERIFDGVFTHDGKRICDSLPRLKGNLIAQKNVKMDLNIRSLNFVIRPNEAKKYIPTEHIIAKGDWILAKNSIGLEGVEKTVSKIKVKIGLGEPPSPRFDVIRLESAELINTLGIGELERLWPLSGKIGDANRKFAESINNMIDENYHLLWTKAGVSIVDSMMPNFFINN